MKRPNILFIMTDEQRYDTFSFNNPKIITPNLDKLIKDSVYFQNAYCSNPSCIPSRAAIMTGKFPTLCKCPTYISYLPKEEKTYMSKLRDNGYYTAVIGKQHFWKSEIDKGYDYEFIVDGHSPNADPNEIELYLEFLKDNNIDNLESLSTNELIIGGSWLGCTELHIDSFIGNKGKEWLSNHIDECANSSSSKPWYMTLSFPGPHQPYDLEGTKYSDLYSLENMEYSESTYEDLESKPPHFNKLNPKAYINKYDSETFKKTKRAYYANMTLIDEKIGAVIDMLKQKGEYHNTMIIFSTDHGDFMGDFGLTTKAQYLSEALMRVPLFVKPPIKEFSGFTVTDYVTNIDIASTCLTIAEAETEITYGMENYPYSDYWTQKKPRTRNHVYMEAHDMKCVIERGIKTIYYVEREYGELYDLNNDPNERVNLWNDKNYQYYKTKALSKIIDKMFRMSPKSEIKWNTFAPKI